MKIKQFGIAVLDSLGIYACSSKNDNDTAGAEATSEDKIELALEYCRKLLKGFAGEDQEIFPPSAAAEHLTAAQTENPKFFGVDGSGFKRKKDVEFLSIFEESLFDCEKELNSNMQELLKAA